MTDDEIEHETDTDWFSAAEAGRERIREARDECRCPYVQPGVVPGADDLGVARSVTKALASSISFVYLSGLGGSRFRKLMHYPSGHEIQAVSFRLV